MQDTALELLQFVFEKGLINKVQADEINLKYLESGQPMETLLLKSGYCKPRDIAEAKSKIFRVPFVSLGLKALVPEMAKLVPEPVARRYLVVPFAYNESSNLLSVGIIDPLDVQLIDFLEKKTGKSIAVHIAVEDDIRNAIDRLYSQRLGEDVTAALKESGLPSSVTQDKPIDKVIREAPIAQIVSALLEQGIQLRASDIHIEPREGDTRIRYRIDGILQERLLLPHRLHDAVVSRIKILADLKIDEKRIPQDGRFHFAYQAQEIDLRVSTLPTVHGEKIVMRLLQKTGGIPELSSLGLEGLALKNLEKNIVRPHGIILVTGPTGSGKTTTLYSVLNRLNKTSVNIMTLEDPVEYEITGINQVQVNPAAGLTFANGLRAFLRQDPNIILVGEIRDIETTDLSIQAALTGHLVFSTLHTNNASGAVPRLLDMGAEPFLVASALNAVVGQRIVRKICTNCSVPFDPDPSVITAIRTVLGNCIHPEEKIQLRKGTGRVGVGLCEVCSGSGYFGRIGIFEVFSVSDVISKLILTRSSMRDIEKQAIQEGMITLKQDGYLKAIHGITSVEEVLRVAEE